MGRVVDSIKAVPLMSKRFSDDTAKGAYMKAMRWYAESVLNDDDLNGGVIMEFERDRKKNFPTYTLNLYISVEMAGGIEQYCRCCREVEASMIGDGKPDCGSCKLIGYDRQSDEKLKIKKKVKSKGIRKNEDKKKRAILQDGV